MRKVLRLKKALLAASVLLIACGEAEPEPEPPARLVRTETVVRDEAVDALVLLGDVEGDVDVRVFPELPERIRAVHVVEGANVSAGDPLVTLEASLPSSDLAQASAALAAAEATRDQVQADLARVRPLVARQALPRSQLESLEASVRASEAQVAQLRAGRRAAGLRRNRTVIRAPVDGVVAQLAVSAGDMVAPSVPVARVVQMDHVSVALQVVEQDYVKLREGMEVDVLPSALEGVQRRGRIHRISPVIDRLSRTGEVEVRIENTDHVLRPGMVAEVRIELERRGDVVLVPSRAVLMTTRTDTENVAHVYLREGSEALRREIRIGRRYPTAGESRLEVVGGLEGGEEVIVEGQHMLRDGVTVRVDGAVEDAEPQLAGSE
ncbi:MAG: efflux RND transporter periplasmic adaptor subunit [Myxococcota bacterium]